MKTAAPQRTTIETNNCGYHPAAASQYAISTHGSAAAGASVTKKISARGPVAGAPSAGGAAPQDQLADEGEQASPPRWKRRFIDEHKTPDHALTWRTNSEKSKLLRAWRNGVGKAFPESGRPLRIAWTLEGLFGNQGYAFPTDAYLSRELVFRLKMCSALLPRSKRLERSFGRRCSFGAGRANRSGVSGHRPK